MSQKQFIVYLLAVSVISFGIHVLLNVWSLTAPYQEFSLMSILFFTILSVLFFRIGMIGSNSKNLYLFNNLISIIMFSKLTFCSVLIIYYAQTSHPESKYFVVPFAIYYFIYTGFELYYMSKLARKK